MWTCKSRIAKNNFVKVAILKSRHHLRLLGVVVMPIEFVTTFQQYVGPRSNLLFLLRRKKQDKPKRLKFLIA